MRKFLVLLMLLAVSSNSVCFAAAKTYEDRIREKQYRMALSKGCPTMEVKDVGTATTLGFIFGGGSYYTGNIGMGIAGTLLWPISILWDPALSGEKAKKMNQEETILYCQEKGYKLPTSL